MSNIIALDLIKGAMLQLGVLAVGETPSAEEANDGLTALNDVLETWSLESLSVYGSDVETFAVSAEVAKYTIGTAGTWNMSRPTSIDNAYVTINSTDFTMSEWTLAEYDAIAVKQAGGIPSRWVYLNDFPSGLVILYPTPSQAMAISIDAPRILTSVATLATTINLPPGYNRALRYALALEMAPQYPGCTDVSSYARSTMAVIKRANRTPMISGFDSTLTGGGWPIWQGGPY